MNDMEKEAEKKYKRLKLRYNELSDLIAKNTRSADFLKMVSERNDLSVQMEVCKQQIDGRWQPKENFAQKIVINPNVKINEY